MRKILISAICMITIFTSMSAYGDISPAVKEKMDVAENKLKEVELVIKNIENNKLIKENYSEDFSKSMYEYAEAMKSAFDGAIKESEEAANSKGVQGNVDSLKKFEDTATANKRRLATIEKKAKRIELNLKKGLILVEKPVIQKMTPNEQIEFKKFLAPEGTKKFKINHPELFAKPISSLESLKFSGIEAIDSTLNICQNLPTVGDFLVSPVHASIAAPCVTPCISKNWAACVPCLARAGAGGIEEWNSFVRCWNGCSGWWKWVCKAKCLAKFVYKLY